MHETVIKPRISEVNAFDHISNTVIPVWLEEALQEFFLETLRSTTFTYLLANLEQNFRREILYGNPVQIKTSIKQLGNSSVSLVQEVWQDGTLAVDAKSVVVYVNKETRRSAPLPLAIRELFETHCI